MKKFVKFLGGEKGNSATYHSIWSVPAPESGSRAVVTNTKESRQKLSTKKPQAPQHISSLNQPSVAELSSPTTSAFSARTEGTSIAELSASSDAQISELHAWNPDVHSGRAISPREEPHWNGEQPQPNYTRVFVDDDDDEPADPILAPTPPPAPTTAPPPTSTPKPKSELASDLLIFSDTTDAIPLFGRQFGIAPTSIVREQEKAPEPEPEPEPKPEQPEQTPPGPKSPQALFQQVDEELEALYVGYLKNSCKQKPPSESANKAKRWRSKSEHAPEACIICLEPFGPDGVKAPDTLSIACQHTPSVCYICLAKSIKHDLEAKFWNEIKCPECKTLFVHEDIKRFADEETFARYNNFSFRAAVSVDKNFVWCLDCPFGQLHESGAEQPLVRCLNCNSESCFKHSIKWHDEFTCDEYDAILWDPDSYRSIKERTAGRTGVEREYLKQKDLNRAKKKETARQTKLHEAQKKAARKKQQEEASRLRKEKKAAETEAARAEPQPEDEDNEEETSKNAVEYDFREKIEMLKRRMREVELSVNLVEEIAKRCPGCQWPIEKNEGCDHMTCIKCRHEFCWVCLNDYNEIRRVGNSMHKPDCKFHTDNLPIV